MRSDPSAIARPEPVQDGDRSHASFRGILNENDADGTSDPSQEAPEYFRDLNLDQVVQAITAGKEEYHLKPFFQTPVRTTDAIQYRHEVMRDLENSRVLECIKAFAEDLRLMRQKLALATKLYHRYQKERWFLHAVELYCATAGELNDRLSRLRLSSRGLLAFRGYLADYVGSERFTSLLATTTRVARDLAEVRYSVLIKGNGFKVRKYDSERDYTVQIVEKFEKFRRGAAKDYKVKFSNSASMNHVEEKIVDFVALLNGDVFFALSRFCTVYRDYADPVLVRFDREIQFYVSYIEYMGRFKRERLGFCYPCMSATDKDVHANETFDLALATKLLATATSIVCNDFSLAHRERVLLVSGPNQGGKTTFARTFGQLHHLASIGCPVPGRDARMFLFDAMFTHFEREEDIKNLNGKLQDDLIRIHDILGKATPRSVIIMNEIFNSTTLADAIFLARKVIERVIELDCLCVCVTFLDELASMSDTLVSLVSAVVPENPALRTYKVIRRPADGRAYAVSIAEKYGLTYECLKARLHT